MNVSNTMRAAQLIAYKQPLEIRVVPVPEPRGENVLIRVALYLYLIVKARIGSVKAPEQVDV